MATSLLRKRKKQITIKPEELSYSEPIEAIDYCYNAEFDDRTRTSKFFHPMPHHEEYEARRDSIRIPPSVPFELRYTYMYPLLSREQEQHLFRRMNYSKYLAEKARQKNDQTAYETHLKDAISTQQFIISANVRIVYHFVKTMYLMKVEFADAVQDAMFPLIRSVVKFDYSKGFKFSTYITWALINWRARYRDNTMKRPLTNFECGFLADVIGGAFDDRATENDLRHEQLMLIETVMTKLHDRDKLIVSLRRGLGPKSPSGREEWTLDEVGKHLKITKERVRQLQAKAILKMKNLKQHEIKKARRVLEYLGCDEAVDAYAMC